MFDNREIAALVWLLIIGLWGVSRPEVRTSLRRVGAAALHPKILLSMATLILWGAGLTVVGYRLGLWSPNLLKDTVIWALGPGIALLLGLVDAGDDPHFFRRTVLATIRLGVLIAFFVNFFVLPLPLELLLQPFIAILAIISVVAARNTEHKRVKTLVDALLVLLGLALLAFASYQSIQDPGAIATWDTVRQFALPVWLTIGALPLIFVLAVVSSYEVAFAHLRLGSRNRRANRRVQFALILGLRLRVRDISGFRGYWAHQAAVAGSVKEALAVVRQFLRNRAEAARQKEEKTRRLECNAGVAGRDESGQQLDQREFEETRRALQALATAQMGWYSNRGGRYREELVEILAPRFEREGLPSDHGISLQVSRDGQRWYACRRTVTGWCFAIGATAPPPDQWLFDGPDPPRGFPGDDPSWGERWGVDAIHW